jgi:hypothetical protein
MKRKIATGINWIFSPLLIPTYITLLLLYSGFHFSMFSWPAKRFLLIVIFISTAVMPSITLLISEFGKRIGLSDRKPLDSRIALLFIALYYYLGFYLLNKIPLYAIFKILLLAGAILIVVLMMVSLWIEISRHTAAMGAAFGMMLALSLRIGLNPVQMLSAIVFVSGITGMAAMIRNDNNLWGTLAGFPLGFTVFFLIFYIL